MQNRLRSIGIWLANSFHALSQAIWNRVPSAATARAAVTAVKERASHLPEQAAPAAQTVAAVIRHPILRGIVGWAFWSVLWSAWCLQALAVAHVVTFEGHSDIPGMTRLIEQDHRIALLWSVMSTIAIAWLIGEVVLTWHGRTQGSLRLRGLPESPCIGPQRALFAAAGVSLLTAILLLVADALGATERWSLFYGLGHNPAGFDEIALIQLMFGLCSGAAAFLLRWPAVRWVTRTLLLLAVAFPAALLLVMSADIGRLPPIALVLWPTVLSLPAVLWGGWGTRRVRDVAPPSLTAPTDDPVNHPLAVH